MIELYEQSLSVKRQIMVKLLHINFEHLFSPLAKVSLIHARKNGKMASVQQTINYILILSFVIKQKD
jgi:hypothetical protein